MNVGIIGAEAAKFNDEMKDRAVYEILMILSRAPADSILVSGACYSGGIGIWAEEIADELGIAKIIHKSRNLRIVEDSDIVHSIVVAGYHSEYRGKRYASCYHCKTNEHAKSGACWMALRAKRAEWHVIPVIE